jgi:biopolymer transport protein TolQ
MEGATTLRAVAPGVSEALITTAAGLLVAIPSVIAYNQLTSSLREFGASMDDFSREMVNSLEDIAQGQGADPTEREAARGLHK